MTATGLVVGDTPVAFEAIESTELVVRGVTMAYLYCTLRDSSELALAMGTFRAGVVKRFVDAKLNNHNGE